MLKAQKNALSDNILPFIDRKLLLLFIFNLLNSMRVKIFEKQNLQIQSKLFRF